MICGCSEKANYQLAFEASPSTQPSRRGDSSAGDGDDDIDVDVDVESSLSSTDSTDMETKASMDATSTNDGHGGVLAPGDTDISLRGGFDAPKKSRFPGVLGEVDDEFFHGRFGKWGNVRVPGFKNLLGRAEPEDHGAPVLWVPLYGHQGIVWFDINTLATFVDAVDRLLGISTRAGISYTVSVFRRDRNYQDDDARVEWLAGKKSTTALSAVKVISPVMLKPSDG